MSDSEDNLPDNSPEAPKDEQTRQAATKTAPSSPPTSPAVQNTSEIVDFQSLAQAHLHTTKAKRMKEMQESFERYLPINTESRQVRRRKARKKKKDKK